MKGIQIWFCDVCKKTISIYSKSKHLNPKTQIRKKNATVVKGIESNKSEIDETEYILDKVNKVFGDKYFHTSDNRCVYDITITNIEK